MQAWYSRVRMLSRFVVWGCRRTYSIEACTVRSPWRHEQVQVFTMHEKPGIVKKLVKWSNQVIVSRRVCYLVATGKPADKPLNSLIEYITKSCRLHPSEEVGKTCSSVRHKAYKPDVVVWAWFLLSNMLVSHPLRTTQQHKNFQSQHTNMCRVSMKLCHADHN